MRPWCLFVKINIIVCSLVSFSDGEEERISFHGKSGAIRLAQLVPSYRKQHLQSPHIDRPTVNLPSVSMPNLGMDPVRKPRITLPVYAAPVMDKPNASMKYVQDTKIGMKPSYLPPVYSRPNYERRPITGPAYIRPEYGDPRADLPGPEFLPPVYNSPKVSLPGKTPPMDMAPVW